MTPIKEIWVIDTTVSALDYADKLNFIAGCVDESTALLIASKLGEFHNKEVYAFKPSLRRMVSVGGSS